MYVILATHGVAAGKVSPLQQLEETEEHEVGWGGEPRKGNDLRRMELVAQAAKTLIKPVGGEHL